MVNEERESRIMRFRHANANQIVDRINTQRGFGWSLDKIEPRNGRLDVFLSRPLPRQDVTLTLTPDQAQVVVDVCGRVGGDPAGPRGRVDEVIAMLWDAGYSYMNKDAAPYAVRGTVHIETKER